MFVKRFLIRVSKSFLISVLFYILLRQFLDSQTASIIFILGFIVFLIGLSLLGWFRSARRNQVKILPQADVIPEELRDTDSLLSSLGFKHVNTAQHTKSVAYMYWNDSQDIIVAIGKGKIIGVRFSTYFNDGFYVSTDYPAGAKSETKKILRHVVKSSIEAAFDYHQQQVQQHISIHGQPKPLASIREMIDWEDENKIRVDLHKTNVKFSLKVLSRYVLAWAVTHIIWYTSMVVLQFGYGYFGYTELPSYHGLVSNLIYIGVLILLGAWAYRPMYKPETVEDRKKKEFA